MGFPEAYGVPNPERSFPVLKFINSHETAWMVSALVCVGYIIFKVLGGRLWRIPKDDGYGGTNVFMTIIFWVCVTSFLFMAASVGFVVFSCLYIIALLT